MSTGTTIIDTVESDAGTWTAHAEESVLYPAAAVINPFPGVQWRNGASATSAWIKVDLGFSKTIDYMMMAGCNFDKGLLNSINVYATDDANLFATFTSEADWSGSLFGAMKNNARYAKLDKIGSSVTKRYFIIFIDYNLASSSGTHIGRIVLGTGYRLPRAYSDNFDDRLLDKGVRLQAGVSQSAVVGIDRDPVRSVNMFFRLLAGDVRKRLLTIYKAQRRLIPFFIDMYPDDSGADEVIYGTFTAPPVMPRSLLDKADVRIKVEELLGVPDGSV